MQKNSLLYFILFSFIIACTDDMIKELEEIIEEKPSAELLDGYWHKMRYIDSVFAYNEDNQFMVAFEGSREDTTEILTCDHNEWLSFDLEVTAVDTTIRGLDFNGFIRLFRVNEQGTYGINNYLEYVFQYDTIESVPTIGEKIYDVYDPIDIPFEEGFQYEVLELTDSTLQTKIIVYDIATRVGGERDTLFYRDIYLRYNKRVE